MKVVLPKSNGSGRKPPIMSLVDDESTYELTKANSVAWDLRTVPADQDSSTYRKQVRVLSGDEPIRQVLRWRADVDIVYTGLEATTVAARRTLIVRMMRLNPLATFNTKMSELAGERYNAALVAANISDTARGDNRTTDRDQVRNNGREHYLQLVDLETATNHVVESLLPRQILPKFKRALRREIRKPAEMSVRTYFQHLMRINNEELPGMPPAFDRTQCFTDDNLNDIILFATPNSWQKEMDRQRFDPMEKSPVEVIAFMEAIEAAEEFDGTSSKVASAKSDYKSDKPSKKSKKGPGNPKKQKKKFYCKEHGENWTHDTKDCRTLQNKKGSFPNKTWDRKSEEAKKEAKDQFAALVAKQVKKTLAAADKKRRSKNDDSDGDDCFLLQSLQGNLDGFNYEAMENLTISDDEIEV